LIYCSPILLLRFGDSYHCSGPGPVDVTPSSISDFLCLTLLLNPCFCCSRSESRFMMSSHWERFCFLSASSPEISVKVISSRLYDSIFSFKNSFTLPSQPLFPFELFVFLVQPPLDVYATIAIKHSPPPFPPALPTS